MHRLAFVLGAFVAGCGCFADDPTVAISVVVVDGRREGILVVFHDAEGKVLSTVRTGPDGKATSPRKTQPAQVSALLGYAERHRVVTWVGVELGDELRVANLAPTPPCDWEGSYRLKLSAFAGATSYASRKEGGACPLETVTSYKACWQDKNVIVAVASHEEPIAFAFAKEVPPPTGDNVPLALSPWKTPARIAVDAKNFAPNTTASTVLTEILEGKPLDGTHARRTRGTLGEHLVAPGLADRYAVSAIEAAQVGKRTMTAYRTEPEPVTFDFADALPAITEAAMDLSDPARPAFSWRSTAPLVESDGGWVEFEWTTGGSSAGLPADSGDWQIVVPPTAVHVKAPILPVEAAA